jgi:cytoskeleton protein RodZ
MPSDTDRISRTVPPVIVSKLRTARESQGRTLSDIASATRINRKFLEDLERGTLPDMPATYVRAFFRTYALELGLDGPALLKELEASVVPDEPVHSPGTPATASEIPLRVTASAPPPEFTRRRQRNVLAVLIIVLVVGMVAVVSWIRQDRNAPPAQEISFSDVVKEQESRAGKTAGRHDTTGPLTTPAAASVIRDSLTLEAVATDSVQFKCTIDGVRTIEYTFSPLFKMQWKASRSFLVSMSNAAALTFTLNGKKIGPLSSTRKPLKNYTLSWETMRKAH